MVSADRPTRVTEPRPDPERKNDRPTIRSHHLRFAGWAMGLGNFGGTPESTARQFTAVVESWLNSEIPYYEQYARTTVGANKEHSDEYKRNLELGLQEFVDAPDNAAYTVVEEVSDTIICEKMASCGLGHHCRRKIAKLPDKLWTTVDETKDMTEFLDAAKSLGIEPQIELTMSDSIDVDQVQVRQVTLPAGEIKRVLRFMAEDDAYKGFFYFLF